MGKAKCSKNPWFKRSSTSSLCSSTQAEEKVCGFCSKDHNVCSCINFLSMTVKERFRRASAKGLCFLCLESGHKSNSCGRKTLCKHCKGRHHHFLHTDKPPQEKPPQEKPPLEKTGPPESPSASQEEVPKDVTSNVTVSSVGTNEFGKVILQTVPAVLRGSNGNSMVVRCFLHSGSQTSFIKQCVIEQLGLGPSVRISVSGFGGKQDKACLRKRVSCTLAPVDKPRCSREFEALITSEICHPAEAVETNLTMYSHLKDVTFQEELPREQKPIDILIGLDFHY